MSVSVSLYDKAWDPVTLPLVSKVRELVPDSHPQQKKSSGREHIPSTNTNFIMESQRQEGSDHQQSFILSNGGGWNFN